MDSLNKIFGYYDKVICNLSVTEQAIISLILLIVLVWQIFMVIKSGHWIFIALLIALLPGTWPATKKIAELLWMIVLFLFTRVLVIFS